MWDKNGRSSPTQFFQIIDNENGEQVNDTGKMWRHDQKKVDTLRIKSMMMTVLFQKEKMGRTERKILQLDRFSLLVIPIFYALTVGIFIAAHNN